MRKKKLLGVIKHPKNLKKQERTPPTIAHFLLTRFNLRKSKPQPDGWLEKRVELFERFCLPSIKNQTNKNFHWIIFFEESTKGEIQPHLDQWLKEVPWIVPAWCNPFDGERIAPWAKPIIEGLIGTKNYYLTSRVDNDDGLHPETMRIFRNYAKKYLTKRELPFEGVILDVPVGLRYDVATSKLYSWKRPHSSFMSLLLKAGRGPFRTVHSFPEGHTTVYKYAEVHFISQKPAWVQVIHDTNVLNKLGRKEKLMGVYENFTFEMLKRRLGMTLSPTRRRKERYGKTTTQDSIL